MYKLKNRNLDKNEELNIKGKAYSMLAETIIQLPKNISENENITEFRNIYFNLKLAVEDAKANKKILVDDTDYNFYGNYVDFRKYSKIISNILPEFEYALSNLYGKKIKIEFTSKYKKKEAMFSFRIKEV